MLSELEALITLFDDYLKQCQPLQVATDLDHLPHHEAALTNYEHLQTLEQQLGYMGELDQRITALNAKIKSFIGRAPVNARGPETDMHQEYLNDCYDLCQAAQHVRIRIQAQIAKAKTYDEFVQRRQALESPRHSHTNGSPINWDAPMGSQGQQAHTAAQAAQRANVHMETQLGSLEDNTARGPQARPSERPVIEGLESDTTIEPPARFISRVVRAQAPTTQTNENRHFLNATVTSSSGATGALGMTRAPVSLNPGTGMAPTTTAAPSTVLSASPRPLDVTTTNSSTETAQLAKLMLAQQQQASQAQLQIAQAIQQQGDALARLAGVFQNQGTNLQAQMTQFTETIATNVQSSQDALLKSMQELVAGLKHNGGATPLTETTTLSANASTTSALSTGAPLVFPRLTGGNSAPLRTSNASSGGTTAEGTGFLPGGYRSMMDARTEPSRTETTYKVAPKEPKPFENSYTDWPRFWEEFTNFVNQTNLDVMSQGRLLKRCLAGEALQAVSYLSETSEDYDTMVQTLKRQYDQPDLMLQCYVTEIQNVKPARDPPDPKDQRRFYGQTFALLQRVKRCGVDINHMTVKQTLMSKLAPKAQDHVLQTFARLSLEEQTTEKALEALEEYVRYLERSAAFTDINRKFSRSATPMPPPTRTYAAVCKGYCEGCGGSNGEKESRTENTHVNAAYRAHEGSRDRRSYPSRPMGKVAEGRQRQRPNRCMFCHNRGHASMRCEEYQTLRQRLDRLKEQKRCTKCTQRDHTETECKRTIGQCIGCSRRGDHIALLCPELISRALRAAEGRHSRRDAPRPKTSSRQTYKVMEEPREGSPAYSEDSCSSRTDYEGTGISDSESVYGVAARRAEEETHVHMAGADERTVLQCVQAEVTNPETKAIATVKIFLDGGSSQTFIGRSLAKGLGLRLGPPRQSTVLTFGKQRTEMCLQDTRFCLVLRNGSRAVVKAEATDDLTAHMPMVDPDEVEKVLQNPEKPVRLIRAQPDILLGQDYHHLLRISQIGQRMENGFCAYDTEVGTVISGQGKVENPEIIKPRAHFCYHATTHVAEAQQVEADKPEAKTCTATDQPKVCTDTSVPKASELLTLAEKILSLEGLGIKPEEVTCNEEYVLENFRKNLKRLPVRSPIPVAVSNS